MAYLEQFSNNRDRNASKINHLTDYIAPGLQSTVMYEMSKCSEDTAVEIDFSIDDSDLSVDGLEGEKGEIPLNLGRIYILNDKREGNIK